MFFLGIAAGPARATGPAGGPAIGARLGTGTANPCAPVAPIAAAPLRDVAGFLLVTATIEGRAASLLVDTGSDAGLLSGEAVRTLGLAVESARPATVEGTGGGVSRVVPVALLPQLLLGRLALLGVPMPVGPLPASPTVAPPVAGLIGGDLLSRFAIAVDVPDGTLAFYPDRPGCVASPWSGPVETLPLRAIGVRRTVAAILDGHRIEALVDTGARSRIVARRTALAVGVDPATLDAEPGGVTAGIDLQDAIYHWHRFGSLRIGDELVGHPVLTVTPLAGGDDMLLGADWFARHRVLLSYANDRMVVQRVPGDRPSAGGAGRP